MVWPKPWAPGSLGLGGSRSEGRTEGGGGCRNDDNDDTTGTPIRPCRAPGATVRRGPLVQDAAALSWAAAAGALPAHRRNLAQPAGPRASRQVHLSTCGSPSFENGLLSWEPWVEL